MRVLLLFCTVMLSLMACQSTPSLTYLYDFSDAGLNRDWTTEYDDFGQTIIENGKLYIRVTEPSVMQYATLKEPLLKDFVFSVDATLHTCGGHCAYGILFRMQDEGSFYRLQVDERGRYLIERRNVDGQWLRLTENDQWGVSNKINAGVGAQNRLMIATRGNQLIFTANGDVVTSISSFDRDYGRGRFALTAGTYNNLETIVIFDNVTIKDS